MKKAETKDPSGKYRRRIRLSSLCASGSESAHDGGSPTYISEAMAIMTGKMPTARHWLTSRNRGSPAALHLYHVREWSASNRLLSWCGVVRVWGGSVSCCWLGISFTCRGEGAGECRLRHSGPRPVVVVFKSGPSVPYVRLVDSL